MRTPVRAWSSLLSCRAAVTAIAAAVYLAVASAPCPQPRADRLRAHGPSTAETHVHGAAPREASASLTAACLCGCERRGAHSGVATPVDAVLPSPPAPPLGRPQSAPCEVAQRLPDAPLSVDSPVPIAA